MTAEANEISQVVHGTDAEYRPIFSLLVKRSYEIHSGAGLMRSEHPVQLRKVDEYYDHGDPESATIKFESDLAPFKPFTDIVVIGTAYAPQGTPAVEMNVGVTVGPYSKVIRVFGDRQCRYNTGRVPTFTDPMPFQTLEIRYERAFGGKDEVSAPLTPFIYPRNDMGCGLALKNTRERVDGLPLPNFEDPSDLLTPERVVMDDPYRWNRLPLPQGFGWMHRSWYPRSSFAGSLPPYLQPDEVMREELLGLVPSGQVALSRQFRLPSFHCRFNNGASLGLLASPLAGDERVQIFGLTPFGRLEFALPGDRPRLMLDIGLGENELEPVLHTICIRPDDMRVELVWRGAHLHPGLDWLPQMSRLHAEVV